MSSISSPPRLPIFSQIHSTIPHAKRHLFSPVVKLDPLRLSPDINSAPRVHLRFFLTFTSSISCIYVGTHTVSIDTSGGMADRVDLLQWSFIP